MTAQLIHPPLQSSRNIITGLQGNGRFESKYLKAKALLKANIRKQLSDLKAKIVECQRGSSLVHGETRSRKRGVIRITFKVGKEHFLHSEAPPPKRQKTNSEAVPLKEVKYGTGSFQAKSRVLEHIKSTEESCCGRTDVRF